MIVWRWIKAPVVNGRLVTFVIGDDWEGCRRGCAGAAGNTVGLVEAYGCSLVAAPLRALTNATCAACIGLSC